jgi:S1-C subfamily serine protease
MAWIPPWSLISDAKTCWRRTEIGVRAIILAAVLAALVAACGGREKTRTVTVTEPSATTVAARPITTSTTATRVSGRTIIAAERSVLPENCKDQINANGGVIFGGTGFVTATGVITALHPVAGCAAGAIISFGEPSGTVEVNDTTHDLALVSFHSTESHPPALQLESATPYVGEPLALVGVPGTVSADREGTFRVARGTVTAIDQAARLRSAEGLRETLSDAIFVSVPRVVPGESGGPAIDGAGKVVGVIEGYSKGVASLTPVSDVSGLG